MCLQHKCRYWRLLNTERLREINLILIENFRSIFCEYKSMYLLTLYWPLIHCIHICWYTFKNVDMTRIIFILLYIKRIILLNVYMPHEGSQWITYSMTVNTSLLKSYACVYVVLPLSILHSVIISFLEDFAVFVDNQLVYSCILMTYKSSSIGIF